MIIIYFGISKVEVNLRKISSFGSKITPGRSGKCLKQQSFFRRYIKNGLRDNKMNSLLNEGRMEKVLISVGKGRAVFLVIRRVLCPMLTCLWKIQLTVWMEGRKYKHTNTESKKKKSSFLAFYHVINSSHPPTRLFAAYDYPFAKYHLPRRKWKIKRPLLEFFKTFRSSKSVR